MSTSDYEGFRQELERQLHADVELLFEAYRTKLRAYETVARARGELSGSETLPPLSLPAGLSPAQAPAAAPAPPWPGPPAAPVPGRRKKAVLIPQEAVDGALALVGDEFDRDEFRRALGYEPSRASLHRVLTALIYAGKIEIASWGMGRLPHRYRKRSPASAPPADTGTQS